MNQLLLGMAIGALIMWFVKEQIDQALYNFAKKRDRSLNKSMEVKKDGV